MLAKIKECRTVEELHNIGIDVSLSELSTDEKRPYYIAIEEQMKLLNDIMAVHIEFTSSDVGFEDYSFEE